jgi:MFS transporter, FSR family, fosmidomycin resistance protein
VAIAASSEPAASEAPVSRGDERRVLGVTTGAHVLHDGYTDLIWFALPIWQAEFGLSYAAVGFLRTIFSGTMATLQIPSSMLAERIGGRVVLAVGTALVGLCYCLSVIGDGFYWLVAALLLGGIGCATQHPIGSALVGRAFTGARSLSAFGTYNFAGDLGKALFPAAASVLIMIMPWRPALGLLGLVGIMAAVLIFIFTPRFASEGLKVAPKPKAEAKPTGRLGRGFHLMLLLGTVDAAARGGFFVLLPFLLIGKGANVATAGFGLSLLFIGGAAGKLALGWLGKWFGVIPIICITKLITAAGMLAVLVLPLELTMVLLPLFGVALNGGTTVTYGSVPDLVTDEQRTRAFSIFYTGTIGAGAVAPAVSGALGDLLGIQGALIVVVVVTVATIGLALMLRPTLQALRTV